MAANSLLDNVPVTGAESLLKVVGGIASMIENPMEIDMATQEKLMDNMEMYSDIASNIESEEELVSVLGGFINILSKVGEATSNTLDVTSPNSTDAELLREQLGDSPEAKEKVAFFYSANNLSPSNPRIYLETNILFYSSKT